MSVDEFWNEFLTKTGKDKNLKYIEAFYFDQSKESAGRLLELVLKGKKKATSSSKLVYEVTGDKMPQSGDYSVVTDWDGNPKCIIETKKTTILPFKDITFELCIREGENDTLESWQEGHRRFFMAEGKECGYEFSEDMPVVFEDFEVVFSL